MFRTNSLFIITLIIFFPLIIFGQSIYTAIEKCNKEQISKILELGYVDTSSVPIPMLAAFHCDLETLKLFRTSSFDWSQKGLIYLDEKKESFYGSLLAVAAGRNDLKMLKYLIEDVKININDQEWNPESQQENGWTALHWACFEGHGDIVKYLLNSGADIELRDEVDGSNALMVATINNHKKLIQLLIEKGATINSKDDSGWTPLHLAAEVNALKIAKMLLEEGARLDVINRFGYTPLGIAQETGNDKIVQLFLEYSSYKKVNKLETPTVRLQTNLDAVNQLQFSRNNRFLIVNDKLFDLRSGRKISSHKGLIARFSYNEKYLLVLDGNEGIPKLWDWHNNKMIGKFTGEGLISTYLSKNPFYKSQQIFCNSDSNLIITYSGERYKGWDISTGKEQFFPCLSNAHFIDIDASTDLIGVVDSQGLFSLFENFDLEISKSKFRFEKPGYELKQIQLFDKGRQVAFLFHSEDKNKKLPFSSIELLSTESGVPLRIINIPNGASTFNISPTGNYTTFGGLDSTVYIMHKNNFNPISLTKSMGVVNILKFNADESLLAIGSSDRSASVYNLKTKKLLQEYKGLLQQDIGGKITFIKFSKDGRYIHNGLIGRIFDLHYPSVYKFFSITSAISKDQKLLVRRGNKDQKLELLVINLPDYLEAYKNDQSIKELVGFEPDLILKGHLSKPQKIAISPDNQFVSSISQNNQIIAWSLKDGKQVLNYQPNKKITNISFTPDSKQMYVEIDSMGVEIFETRQFTLIKEVDNFAISNNGKWKGFIKNDTLTVLDKKGKIRLKLNASSDFSLGLTFSHNEKYIVFLDNRNEIALWDIELNKHIRDFEEPNVYHKIAFSPDDQYLATKNAKLIDVWSVTEGNKLFGVDEFCNWESPIAFSPDSRFLATSGDKNYSIILWDLNSQEVAFKIYFPGRSVGEGQFVIVCNDGYYMSSKNATAGLQFEKDLSVFPFEQFDLKFNRPDIVLKRLGYALPEFVKSYENAYKMRMDKMGFPNIGHELDFHVPELDILNTDIPTITTDSSVIIQIRAFDAKHALARLNVWVNNTPVFGIKGLSILSEANTRVEKDIQIQLSKGINKIQISCYNDQGVESLKQTIEVKCNKLIPEKPNLFFIGIGLDHHLQSEMDLDYPVKDVKGFGELLRTRTDIYEEINCTYLLDQQVTRNKLIQLKKQLMKTEVDDVLILFYAGHGIRDKELNYYLASHDINFQIPEERGIRFSLFERLLDSIPARNKLLLIDACFSGEIDESHVEKIDKVNTKMGKIIFRLAGNHQPVNKKSDSRNSFELMKELFVDIRRGTGATVISSSSGVEPALESSEWGNSAFTHALLLGLNQKEADGAIHGVKDSIITVAELGRYLSLKVLKLTHGLQRPNSRSVNIYNDFILW